MNYFLLEKQAEPKSMSLTPDLPSSLKTTFSGLMSQCMMFLFVDVRVHGGEREEPA